MMSQKKYFHKFKEPLVPMPNLVVSQNESFKWLVEKGLNEVFTEFASISDYSGKKFELSFKSVKLEKKKKKEKYKKIISSCPPPPLFFFFFYFFNLTFLNDNSNFLPE